MASTKDTKEQMNFERQTRKAGKKDDRNFSIEQSVNNPNVTMNIPNIHIGFGGIVSKNKETDLKDNIRVLRSHTRGLKIRKKRIRDSSSGSSESEKSSSTSTDSSDEIYIPIPQNKKTKGKRLDSSRLRNHIDSVIDTEESENENSEEFRTKRRYRRPLTITKQSQSSQSPEGTSSSEDSLLRKEDSLQRDL